MDATASDFLIMASLQGQLLIATPQLLDPNFYRTVILILQHDDEHALGVILNRAIPPTIDAVWPQVSDTPCEADGHLHKGGPCDGPLMVVHTNEEHSQIEVMPGVHMSTEKDAVEDLVSRPTELSLKFFVGYSGWGAGQLENEIAEGSWLTLPASTETIFEGGDDLWESLQNQVGRSALAPWIDPRRVPPDPSVN